MGQIISILVLVALAVVIAIEDIASRAERRRDVLRSVEEWDRVRGELGR